MANCFQDITVEFLAVAFHSILYYAAVYPKSVFEIHKKYNIVVYRSIHPELNQYLDMCLKSIADCLKSDKLSRVVFAITDNEYTPLLNFVFQFDKNSYCDETKDAYLVKLEQHFRAFCLKIFLQGNYLVDLPKDSCFSIFIHTNESNAVAMATNPESEEFPLVEVSEQPEKTDKIIPLTKFSIRSHEVQTYVEIKSH